MMNRSIDLSIHRSIETLCALRARSDSFCQPDLNAREARGFFDRSIDRSIHGI
jgi:hypothetical protein